MIGKRFGRLVVVSFSHKDSAHKSCYVCRCDCGNLIVARANNLKTGNTKSCGCFNIDRIIERNKKHGLYYTRLHSIWSGIIRRTTNANDRAYDLYGGRGVTVCKEWRSSFLSFYNWAITNGYKDNLTIDRIDNDGNYEPENCRWVSMKEQSRNKRNNVVIKYNGKSLCRAEWEDLLGFTKDLIRNRLRRGWSLTKTMSTPIIKRGTK